LEMIDEVLDDIIISVERESKNISDQVNKLLEIMETGIPYSANYLINKQFLYTVLIFVNTL
ncbi:MAG: hypothetical protein IKK01_01315, partial [Clostridia bacterium]|nr:hypothetical protein [Clostridia bacterium]